MWTGGNHGSDLQLFQLEPNDVITRLRPYIRDRDSRAPDTIRKLRPF